MKKLFTKLVIACFVMFLTFNAFSQKKEGNDVLMNNSRSFFNVENGAMKALVSDPASDMRAVVSEFTKNSRTTPSKLTTTFNEIKYGVQKAKVHSRTVPDTAWTKTIHEGGLEACYSVQQTSDGGYIMAGRTNTHGAGDMDAWLIKTDANGDTLWSKTYGDYYVDETYAVKQTSDGGYILCGTSTQFGWSGEGWLVKTDANGNIIWNHGYHPEQSSQGDWDYLYDVQETSDGGFIAVGFGPVPNYMWQGWMIKVNSNGNIVWNQTCGDEYWERLLKVEPSGNGNFIAVGDKHVGYNNDSLFVLNGWIVNFNGSNGDTLWTKHYGGPLGDQFRSVKPISDGGFVFTGERKLSEVEGYLGWLVKTDNNGNIIWNNTYGNGGLNEVVEAPDGNFVVGGETVADANSGYAGWLMKMDVNGEMIWNKIIDDSRYDDMAMALNKTSDGGYIIGGRTNSGMDFSDLWLVKINPELQSLTSFTENFDEVTPPALPDNWTGIVKVRLSNTIAEAKTTLQGMAPSAPNTAFLMNGLDGSNGQLDTHAFVALVTPLVQVGNNGSVLTFQAEGGDAIQIGTMSDPADTSTFTLIQTVPITYNFTQYTVTLSNPGNTHIAFKHANTVSVTPLFVDDVTFAPVIPPTPLTSFTENFDEVTPPALPDNWTGIVKVRLSNTIAEAKTTLQGMAPSAPNTAFLMNGLDGSNGQLDTHAFVALVTPLVQVGNNGSVLTFQAEGGDAIQIGTMSDPADTSTFTLIQTVPITYNFTQYTVTLSNPGNTHIAFKHANAVSVTPLFVDDVTFAPTAAPTLTITNVENIVPGPVTIPVHAANVTNMGSFQFTIEYDPSILTYTGVSNWYTGIDAVTVGNPSSGKLTFVWAADAEGINIPDGNFFDFNFNWLTSDGISTNLTWGDNPTPREFADYDGNIFVPDYVNGAEGGFGVGIPEMGSVSIKVFPNPATDVVNITVSNNISTIQVMNYLGMIVYSENITQEKTITLNTSRYSAGNYLIRCVTNNGQTITKKIVIE